MPRTWYSSFQAHHSMQLYCSTRRRDQRGRQTDIPFRVACLSILHQVKRLDGAKGGQQLSTLVISQVVRQASHKHTLIGIDHLHRQIHRWVAQKKVMLPLAILRGPSTPQTQAHWHQSSVPIDTQNGHGQEAACWCLFGEAKYLGDHNTSDFEVWS